MRKFIIFAASLLTLVILIGCDRLPENTPSDTGAASTPVTTAPTQSTAPTLPELTFELSHCVFAEKYGAVYDSKRSFTTTYNGVTYHFTTSISEEDRLDIILESDSIVSDLLQDFPDYTPEITLCFRHDDYPARILDHTLYIGIDHFRTQEYAVGITSAFFGHDVNYGIVYALGTRQAERLSYPTEQPTASLSDALSLYDTAPVYLDMNYPCFLSEYADETTMDKVKTLALAFCDDLYQTEKLDLYTDYSDEKYCRYLSDFLTRNGKGSYDNSDLGGSIFYNGGPVIRLVWENEDAVFYLRDDYKVQYQESHWDSDMLNSGYENLRQLIVGYQLQADRMEDLLGHLETEDSRVDVYFTERFASERYVAGQYTEYYNLIEMFAAGPYLHEYAHYLLRDTEIDSWMNELICYYYGYYPVSQQISYQWCDMVAYYEGLSKYDPQTESEAYLIEILSQKLGHELDWSDPADFEYIFSAYVVVTNGYAGLTDPNGGAQSKYSFMTYLIELVGEEAAIAAITSNTPDETFGKDWQALIEDWEDAVYEEYAWLDKYFITYEGD